MGKTISFISLKGGVGKTTLAAAVAAGLAKDFEKTVLLIDANYSAPNLGLHMDIISPTHSIQDVLHGSATMSDAIHKRHGVDVVPGNFLYGNPFNALKLRDKLQQIKKQYDFVVLDSSPSLNDEVLSAMLASDQLFVVTTPDYATLSCSMKAAKLARQRGKPVAGIIINRISSPLYEISLEEIQESTDIPVVARIKEDAMAKRALFERVPISLHSPRSKMSREIYKLNSAIAGVSEPVGFFGKWFGRVPKERTNRATLKDTFYQSMFDWEKMKDH